MNLNCICTVFHWLSERENLKDFIVPTLAIIIPIGITVIITSRDRKINEKNRKDDLKRYENEKYNLIADEINKNQLEEQELINNFRFYFITMRSAL